MMHHVAKLLIAILPALTVSWMLVATTTATIDRGSTLVCAGMGGDGLSLVEWTAADLAEYENRIGQPPALAHAQTGTCSDPAGLMVSAGWVAGTRWLCSRDADGRWSAGWVWEIYQTGNEASPDPVTGRCPQPKRTSYLNETGYAAATAVHLTELEVAGEYDRLYAWMHPDARARTSQVAMTQWYREEFSERPPVWMTVDDVQLVEWTWNVTGKVYPSTAEVAYRQRFADGTTSEGTVHLVRDGGVWRWFFGA
ncbi:MAG: hypothetical protein M3Z20_20375 [Chloroflexota bacterium]|nr:hypothetical protein [Chloroflexota bacterium]